MAADVSSLFRVLNGYSDDQHLSLGIDSSGEKSSALITRDLLGGGSPSKLANESQELDLDLQVPNGWEKRLDLKVGLFFSYGSVCFLRINGTVCCHNFSRKDLTFLGNLIFVLLYGCVLVFDLVALNSDFMTCSVSFMV